MATTDRDSRNLETGGLAVQPTDATVKRSRLMSSDWLFYSFVAATAVTFLGALALIWGDNKGISVPMPGGIDNGSQSYSAGWRASNWTVAFTDYDLVDGAGHRRPFASCSTRVRHDSQSPYGSKKAARWNVRGLIRMARHRVNSHYAGSTRTPWTLRQGNLLLNVQALVGSTPIR